MEMVTGAKKGAPLRDGRCPSIHHGPQHSFFSLPDPKALAACHLLLCLQCYFLRVQEGP